MFKFKVLFVALSMLAFSVADDTLISTCLKNSDAVHSSNFKYCEDEDFDETHIVCGEDMKTYKNEVCARCNDVTLFMFGRCGDEFDPTRVHSECPLTSPCGSKCKNGKCQGKSEPVCVRTVKGPQYSGHQLRVTFLNSDCANCNGQKTAIKNDGACLDMVHHCPADYKFSTTTSNCIGNNNNHVCGEDGRLYKNSYCAQCHDQSQGWKNVALCSNRGKFEVDEDSVTGCVCKCDSGYEGVKCEKTDPCKNVNCGSFGKCVEGKCACNPGYKPTTSGTSCTRDYCYGITCNNHGTCINGKCDCPDGWKGTTCSEKDYCYNVNCGYGTCDTTSGKCKCPPQYSGDRCQTLDRCYNVKCVRGSCVNGACQCPSGWIGSDCNTVDPCLSVKCGINGVCTNGKCFCKNGYTGDLCSIPPTTTTRTSATLTTTTKTSVTMSSITHTSITLSTVSQTRTSSTSMTTTETKTTATITKTTVTGTIFSTTVSTYTTTLSSISITTTTQSQSSVTTTATTISLTTTTTRTTVSGTVVSKTSKTSTEDVNADACRAIKCVTNCDDECGWSSSLNICTSASETTEAERLLLLGECPKVVLMATFTLTRDKTLPPSSQFSTSETALTSYFHQIVDKRSGKDGTPTFSVSDSLLEQNITDVNDDGNNNKLTSMEIVVKPSGVDTVFCILLDVLSNTSPQSVFFTFKSLSGCPWCECSKETSTVSSTTTIVITPPILETLPDPQANKTQSDKDEGKSSASTLVIVASIVGVLIGLCILFAVMMFLRKKDDSNDSKVRGGGMENTNYNPVFTGIPVYEEVGDMRTYDTLDKGGYQGDEAYSSLSKVDESRGFENPQYDTTEITMQQDERTFNNGSYMQHELAGSSSIDV
eukprot:m.178530 g.178530  ORF g.178530 m.178530 type:complete len:873 (+) comp15469_c0_seq3:172-2790(+)